MVASMVRQRMSSMNADLKNKIIDLEDKEKVHAKTTEEAMFRLELVSRKLELIEGELENVKRKIGFYLLSAAEPAAVESPLKKTKRM